MLQRAPTSSHQSGSGCKPATRTTTRPPLRWEEAANTHVTSKTADGACPWLQAAGCEAFRLPTAAKRSDCQRCLPLAASRGLQKGCPWLQAAGCKELSCKRQGSGGQNLIITLRASSSAAWTTSLDCNSNSSKRPGHGFEGPSRANACALPTPLV